MLSLESSICNGTQRLSKSGFCSTTGTKGGKRQTKDKCNKWIEQENKKVQLWIIKIRDQNGCFSNYMLNSIYRERETRARAHTSYENKAVRGWGGLVLPLQASTNLCGAHQVTAQSTAGVKHTIIKSVKCVSTAINWTKIVVTYLKHLSKWSGVQKFGLRSSARLSLL